MSWGVSLPSTLSLSLSFAHDLPWLCPGLPVTPTNSLRLLSLSSLLPAWLGAWCPSAFCPTLVSSSPKAARTGGRRGDVTMTWAGSLGPAGFARLQHKGWRAVARGTSLLLWDLCCRRGAPTAQHLQAWDRGAGWEGHKQMSASVVPSLPPLVGETPGWIQAHPALRARPEGRTAEAAAPFGLGLPMQSGRGHREEGLSSTFPSALSQLIMGLIRSRFF